MDCSSKTTTDEATLVDIPRKSIVKGELSLVSTNEKLGDPKMAQKIFSQKSFLFFTDFQIMDKLGIFVEYQQFFNF